jgi:hypothetical protein
MPLECTVPLILSPAVYKPRRGDFESLYWHLESFALTRGQRRNARGCAVSRARSATHCGADGGARRECGIEETANARWSCQEDTHAQFVYCKLK